MLSPPRIWRLAPRRLGLRHGWCRHWPPVAPARRRSLVPFRRQADDTSFQVPLRQVAISGRQLEVGALLGWESHQHLAGPDGEAAGCERCFPLAQTHAIAAVQHPRAWFGQELQSMAIGSIATVSPDATVFGSSQRCCKSILLVTPLSTRNARAYKSSRVPPSSNHSPGGNSTFAKFSTFMTRTSRPGRRK